MHKMIQHKLFSRFGTLGTLLLAGLFSFTLQAASPAQSGQNHILVHVLELQGTGPDGQVVSLYRNQSGYTTPLKTLGGVGSQVNGSRLADGAYHTLYVQLRDDYTVVRPDGSSRQGSFSNEGKPTTLRVRGMIMVRGGNANPLRMLPETGHGLPGRRYYGDDDD